MPEILPAAGGKFVAGAGSWSVEFDTPAKGKMTLHAGEKLVLKTLPASIDDLSEASALHDRRKLHLSGDGIESGIEQRGTIPFGTEPSVKRDISLQDNMLFASLDIVMRPSHAMKSVDAGGFSVDGVKDMKIYCEGGKSGIKQVKSGGADGIVYDSASVPVMVEFADEDGERLLFSVGEDMWRWMNASRLDGVSRFYIEKQGASILFCWKIYKWNETPETLPPQGRAWRLTYMFAWTAGIKAPSRKRKFKDTLDMRSCQCPPQLMCSGADGKAGKYPCAAANGTVNILKKWVRRNLSGLGKGDVLLMKNVSPVLCFAAAHQDRAKLKTLRHWDLVPLLEFKRWAEKQLAVREASIQFSAADEDVPFILND